MGTNTKIDWTDATWNPVTGCTKASPGCARCYAETMATRLKAMGSPRYANGFAPTCHYEALREPLHWRKPRRVFVCSMGDLFHEAVPDAFIDMVWAAMLLSPQHTFQVLTKRPERMRRYLSSDPDTTFPNTSARYTAVLKAANVLRGGQRSRLTDRLTGIAVSDPVHFPARHIWLGVTAEDQTRADERIPLLLETPATVRFVSCEPMLGPVLLDNGENSWLSCDGRNKSGVAGEHVCCEADAVHGECFHGIDWVIAGCESGTRRRPADLAWFRSLRDQCQAASVPFFLKQAAIPEAVGAPRVVRKMPALDGKVWAEIPAPAREVTP
jgi:protein gp37